MDNEKIKQMLDTVNNWKVWQFFIQFPLFIGMFILLPYPLVLLGKTGVIESNMNFYELELSMSIGINYLWILFILIWILYLTAFNVSKTNKIRAYYINVRLLFFMYVIAYYEIFIALQYFIDDSIIRYVNWGIFLVSFAVIIRLGVGKKKIGREVSSKGVTFALKIIGILWVLKIFLSVIFEGFSTMSKAILSGIVGLLPGVFALISIMYLSSLIQERKNSKEIYHSQEKYRKEYGYTIKDWYGAKSKEYSEEDKE